MRKITWILASVLAICFGTFTANAQVGHDKKDTPIVFPSDRSQPVYIDPDTWVAMWANLPPVNIATAHIDSLPLVSVGSLPEVTINSLPPVVVSALPDVVVSNLPAVNVNSLPMVEVMTLPMVDVNTLPSVDIGTMPSVQVSSLPTVQVDWSTMPPISVEVPTPAREIPNTWEIIHTPWGGSSITAPNLSTIVILHNESWGYNGGGYVCCPVYVANINHPVFRVYIGQMSENLTFEQKNERRVAWTRAFAAASALPNDGRIVTVVPLNEFGQPIDVGALWGWRGYESP